MPDEHTEAELRFFRWASVVPLVLPMLAGVALWLVPDHGADDSLVDAIITFTGAVAVVGVCSAIPYVIVLLVLFLVHRPDSVGKWVATLHGAPIVIAVLADIVVSILGGWQAWRFIRQHRAYNLPTAAP